MNHAVTNTACKAATLPIGVLPVAEYPVFKNQFLDTPPEYTPIVAADEMPDGITRGVLFVPYEEDDEGESITSINIRAVPEPDKGFPEEYPDWTLLKKSEKGKKSKLKVIDKMKDFDGTAESETPYLFTEPGAYVLRAECGNVMEMDVVM